MKRIILLLMSLFLSISIFAHVTDEPHLEPEGEKCTIESCPFEIDKLSERGLDVISQLPTIEMKMGYIGKKYVLPNIYSIAFLILAIAFGIILLKNIKAIVSIATILVSALLIIGILYSVFYYYASGAEKGLIICKSPDKCEIAMHIHADLIIEACGKQINLPLEKGDLSKTHTHKEENLLHWHDLTP
ncbi:MAG: hypothetical protein QW331_04735, partial [Candidatus Woesearchaeota archaeon]